MSDRALAGRRLLVVEDDYLLARDLCAELKTLGAEIVGPAPSVAQALSLISDGTLIDGAVLDVNLGGEKVFAVADSLSSRGVPLLFTTGYDDWALPAHHAGAVRLEKPVTAGQVADWLVASAL